MTEHLNAPNSIAGRLALIIVAALLITVAMWALAEAEPEAPVRPVTPMTVAPAVEHPLGPTTTAP